MFTRVNNDYLLALAKSRAFRWMQSLEPLRVGLNRFHTRACCGQTPPIQTHAHADLFQAVVSHPKFIEDMAKLKAEQRLTKLYVTAGNKNISI
jgi:hypothetical protein